MDHPTTPPAASSNPPPVDIVFFGAGRTAEWIAGYLDRSRTHRIVGFTVDAAYLDSDTCAGRPLVAWERLEETFAPGSVQLLGPASHRRLNALRRERHFEGKARGYSFATYVDPLAVTHGAALGENVIVLSFALLEAGARLGDGVIVCAHSHIGHHCEIGAFAFIGAHVGLSGGVTIGPGCFLGGKVGALPGVRIGADCFVGGGAVIGGDFPDGTVIPGRRSRASAVPSARIRHRL